MLEVIIKRSNRAKRIRMQVDQNEKLKVVVPQFVPNVMVKRFLKSQEDWIAKQTARIADENRAHPKPQYLEGDTFYYLGERLKLAIYPSRFKIPKVKASEHELIVLSQVRASSVIRKAVEKFYKKKAAEVIFDRLEHFNSHYGFKFHRVSFRNQKSRWGSCSNARNLNFNWRLVMAPIEVIDYVVVHELCHLSQMNHSPQFWGLVAETVPEYKAYKKWLKTNHYLLRT